MFYIFQKSRWPLDSFPTSLCSKIIEIWLHGFLYMHDYQSRSMCMLYFYPVALMDIKILIRRLYKLSNNWHIRRRENDPNIV